MCLWKTRITDEFQARFRDVYRVWYWTKHQNVQHMNYSTCVTNRCQFMPICHIQIKSRLMWSRSALDVCHQTASPNAELSFPAVFPNSTFRGDHCVGDCTKPSAKYVDYAVGFYNIYPSKDTVGKPLEKSGYSVAYHFQALICWQFAWV